MTDRTAFLMFGRRFHNSFRTTFENGLGGDQNQWAAERPLFEHYSCAMYLTGCLAYLEETYGRNAWISSPVHASDFDNFLHSCPDPARTNFQKRGICKAGMEALICIRNAVIHNSGDLSQNNDSSSLRKVTLAAVPGVVLNGSIVSLVSNRQIDFMAYVRLSLVAVAQFQGDG